MMVQLPKIKWQADLKSGDSLYFRGFRGNHSIKGIITKNKQSTYLKILGQAITYVVLKPGY